jgi:hypothetical protein
MAGLTIRTNAARSKALLAAILAAVLCADADPARAAEAPADPASDAPEHRVAVAAAVRQAHSYDEALSLWRTVEDLNAWIGARFEYDAARALQLSETQRRRNGSLPIHEPRSLFAAPLGVCVDLSRFAVETIRAIEPQARPAYLMIEFAPVAVAGNTLRRHWLVVIEREGQRYFLADSKRPGHIAGPYPTTSAFIADYASYRGREIVAYRELPSYQRQRRALAALPAARAAPAE